MEIDEYKRRVIELFKSGKATEAQWDEMAECVNIGSEIENAVPHIDETILKDCE
jgi:hypothetical protein